MKKLKISLLMAMLAIAAVVSAQTSLGIKGGLNISNLVGDEITDKNMLVGGHVGLAADYEFMLIWQFKPDCFLPQKVQNMKAVF